MNENVKQLLNEQLLVKYGNTIKALGEINKAAREFNALVSSAKTEIATIKDIAQTLGISEDEQIKTLLSFSVYAPIAALQKELDSAMKGDYGYFPHHNLTIDVSKNDEEKTEVPVT